MAAAAVAAGVGRCCSGTYPQAQGAVPCPLDRLLRLPRSNSSGNSSSGSIQAALSPMGLHHAAREPTRPRPAGITTKAAAAVAWHLAGPSRAAPAAVLPWARPTAQGSCCRMCPGQSAQQQRWSMQVVTATTPPPAAAAAVGMLTAAGQRAAVALATAAAGSCRLGLAPRPLLLQVVTTAPARVQVYRWAPAGCMGPPALPAAAAAARALAGRASHLSSSKVSAPRGR